MQSKKPTLQEFKNQIESLFGQKLNVQANEAAEDFWSHWDQFNSLFKDKKIKIFVDAFMLASKSREYKNYQTWKGASIISGIIAIISVWFKLYLGISLFVLAIILYFWSNHVKHNDAKKFTNELINEASLNPNHEGFAKLCGFYLSGIVYLNAETHRAGWPQHPSNIISGEQSFIK